MPHVPRHGPLVLLPRAIRVGNLRELELGRLLQALLVDDDSGESVVLAFRRVGLCLLGGRAELGRELAGLLPRRGGSCAGPASPARYEGIFVLFACGIVSFSHPILFFLKLLLRLQVCRRRKRTANQLGLAEFGDSDFLLHIRRSIGLIIYLLQIIFLFLRRHLRTVVLLFSLSPTLLAIVVDEHGRRLIDIHRRRQRLARFLRALGNNPWILLLLFNFFGR
mmetsp:Transcript_52693/g.111947  ORF Transcript_52693/g.111947 Transcript_52693/m.111947 type:complete len:222 (+) Transcript_52693:325-990(+)